MKHTLPLVLLGLSLPAFAGQEVAPAATQDKPFDFCEWLENKPGLLYKNKENPILQSFQIGGRFQWQAAYVDGEDVNGRDFNDTYDEYRRFRIETKTEFLRFFSAKVGVNMVNDQRFSGGELDWGYDTFDEAVFTFDIKKAFDVDALDTLKVNYGRHKFNLTDEVRTSSKEIITIERSGIGNKVYNSGRPTGVTVDLAKDAWSGTVGIFSTQDEEFIDGWNDGVAWYGTIGYKASDSLQLTLDGVYNNDQDADVNFLGYEWATSFNATWEQDRWGFTGSVILGENNGTGARGGNFYGVVAMPWYWIVQEKLQAVVQYQYAGASEDEGIRVNSRYVRAEHSTGVNVNSGRGDENHSLYAGLNYYICDHNAKIMAGIEYNTLDTPAGDVDALSYLIAFRTFF